MIFTVQDFYIPSKVSLDSNYNVYKETIIYKLL